MIVDENHQSDKLIRGAHEIARIIGYSRRNVYELVKRGLPVGKLNGPTSPLVIGRAELMAWIERRSDNC